MTTELKKEVTRLTMGEHRGKRVVVGMTVGDMLVFRQQGTRTRFMLPIGAAFDMAMKLEAAAARGPSTPVRSVKRGLLGGKR